MKLFYEAACVAPAVLDFKAKYSALVDMNMCTETCPCAKGEGNANVDLWNQYINLNEYGRGTDKPFVWGGASDAADNTYAVWSDCWNEKLSSGTDDNTKQLNDFLNTGGWEFVNYVETAFNCASVCDAGLFYVTRDIKDGAPLDECIAGFVNSMGGKALGAGIVCVITGGLTLIAMIGACPLCKGMNDDEK